MKVKIQALDNESNSFISFYDEDDNNYCFIHIQPDEELVTVEYPHVGVKTHFLPAEFELHV